MYNYQNLLNKIAFSICFLHEILRILHIDEIIFYLTLSANYTPPAVSCCISNTLLPSFIVETICQLHGSGKKKMHINLIRDVYAMAIFRLKTFLSCCAKTISYKVHLNKILFVQDPDVKELRIMSAIK